jgi:hypothetical protein
LIDSALLQKGVSETLTTTTNQTFDYDPSTFVHGVEYVIVVSDENDVMLRYYVFEGVKNS